MHPSGRIRYSPPSAVRVHSTAPGIRAARSRYGCTSSLTSDSVPGATNSFRGPGSALRWELVEVDVDDVDLRGYVLDQGDVLPDEFVAHRVAGTAVDGRAPDLVAPEVLATGPEEVLAPRENTVRRPGGLVGEDLAFQVALADSDAKLERLIGVVAELQVHVVVHDAAADSPGQHAAVVRERVEAVGGALGHGERGMQDHPVQQVRELADA